MQKSGVTALPTNTPGSVGNESVSTHPASHIGAGIPPVERSGLVTTSLWQDANTAKALNMLQHRKRIIGPLIWEVVWLAAATEGAR